MKCTLESFLSEKGEKVAAIETKLGYKFKNSKLLIKSLTHRSFIFEQAGVVREDNETLEFLGDAVLDLVISKLLIDKYPEMDEGELTKVRSSLVQEKNLAFMARRLELGDYLLLGKGEECSGGRDKDSILSCGYEAVVGAIFLDGGYEAARVMIEEKFCDRLEDGRKESIVADAKSRLQEITQGKHNEAPVYNLEKAEGPDHAKVFTVSVNFQGKVLAMASARSKKAAEQKAAAEAIGAFDE